VPHNDPFEVAYRIIEPTDAECRAMLADLESVTGNRGLLSLTRLSSVLLRQYLAGSRVSHPNKRLIWLLWAQFCRPGAVQSVNDILSYGRFTSHGGPEHAGKPGSILRPLSRCIDGGEYPRRDPSKGEPLGKGRSRKYGRKGSLLKRKPKHLRNQSPHVRKRWRRKLIDLLQRRLQEMRSKAGNQSV